MRMETSIAVPDVSGIPDASGAFSALASGMRSELKRHCYRMMGGVQDAEDCARESSDRRRHSKGIQEDVCVV